MGYAGIWGSCLKAEYTLSFALGIYMNNIIMQPKITQLIIINKKLTAV